MNKLAAFCWNGGRIMLVWFLGCLFSSNLRAQTDSIPDFFTRPNSMVETASVSTAPDISTSDTLGWNPQFSVGIGAGTKGYVAVDGALRIVPHFNVRLGFNLLQFSVDNFEVNLEDLNDETQQLLIDGEINQSNIELLLEFAFAKEFLRLVAGGAYHFQNNITGRGGLTENLMVQDVILTPEEVGYIEGDFAFTNTISPYLGIGIGRTISQKRISFSADIGTYYRGAPNVTLEATELFRQNVRNEDELEDILEDIRWWPVIALRLGYRFF